MHDIYFYELYNNFFCILLSFVCYLQENFYGVGDNTDTSCILIFYFIYAENIFFSLKRSSEKLDA